VAGEFTVKTRCESRDVGLREFRSLGSGKEEGRVCRTERERERGQPALKSQTDLDLYEGDVEGADREIRRLQREGVRLFGIGGVGSELVGSRCCDSKDRRQGR
jgi:hypothetical protein